MSKLNKIRLLQNGIGTVFSTIYICAQVWARTGTGRGDLDTNPLKQRGAVGGLAMQRVRSSDLEKTQNR